MKTYRKIRVLYLFSLLFTGIIFTGCSTDENAIPLPIAEFTFSGTNNLAVPTTVSFTNTIEIDVNYSWDFGNGETGSGRDPIVTYTEAGTYTVQLTATGEGGSSQVSHEIVVGPLSVTAEHLYGPWSANDWSVIREEITFPGSSTPIIHEWPMNWETLRYWEDGRYERVSLVWIEREYGTYTIADNIITQTPSSGSDDFQPLDILITAFDKEEGLIEAEVSMDEPGVGTITIKVTLQKNGREYFNEGAFPRPSIGDFAGTKWSILEETTTILAYSESTDDYTDVVSTETVTGIPYNFRSILPYYPCTECPSGTNSLFIDNWQEGVYEYSHMFPIKTATIYWMETEEGEEIAILINNNLDDNNIETVSVGFTEIEGERVKFETRSKLLRNDGSEATITEAELAGQWEVISKTEQKDGVDVDPEEANTPPVGFVLTFNSDGSAELGDEEPGRWFLLDNSNFVVASPDGDETLVHIIGFDSAAGDLSIFSKWIEDDAAVEMTMSLKKQ